MKISTGNLLSFLYKIIDFYFEADWNVGNQNKICRNDFSQAWVKACPK